MIEYEFMNPMSKIASILSNPAYYFGTDLKIKTLQLLNIDFNTPNELALAFLQQCSKKDPSILYYFLARHKVSAQIIDKTNCCWHLSSIAASGTTCATEKHALLSLKKCLQYGADPNRQLPFPSATPFEIASKTNALFLGIVLIQYGADIQTGSDEFINHCYIEMFNQNYRSSIKPLLLACKSPSSPLHSVPFELVKKMIGILICLPGDSDTSMEEKNVSFIARDTKEPPLKRQKTT